VRQYKLYVYVPNEPHPPAVHDYDGADDESALKKARSVGTSRTVEIWEAGRLVARIGNDGGTVYSDKK
jgi:hypothetical protein